MLDLVLRTSVACPTPMDDSTDIASEYVVSISSMAIWTGCEVVEADLLHSR